ncbi:hypothetical protein BLNAU_16113 [Blattamonas nauphoetae]|uniref:Uncharacterized protein n=1 Tax=Blattamonas nauphoetae TaxID=2049346 RepID=A0ABQ9XCI4_9EUKA|nr:hypothetical protein BLNAU_16113 [Blattamonas nauphoetae]
MCKITRPSSLLVRSLLFRLILASVLFTISVSLFFYRYSSSSVQPPRLTSPCASPAHSASAQPPTSAVVADWTLISEKAERTTASASPPRLPLPGCASASSRSKAPQSAAYTLVLCAARRSVSRFCIARSNEETSKRKSNKAKPCLHQQ